MAVQLAVQVAVQVAVWPAVWMARVASGWRHGRGGARESVNPEPLVRLSLCVLGISLCEGKGWGAGGHGDRRDVRRQR
ncbi:hypothetical protein GCM10009665_74760 [Kitasatospora nipponensis]|uniref:Secreted protein n=1 Tax=Kitasatospora nipponensis TaxID=258049 RepID=A0ABN1T7U9_9ACTN